MASWPGGAWTSAFGLARLSEHSLHPPTNVVRGALEILVVPLIVPLGPERLVPGLDDLVGLGADAVAQVGIRPVKGVVPALRLELGEALEEGRGCFFRGLLLGRAADAEPRMRSVLE